VEGELPISSLGGDADGVVGIINLGDDSEGSCPDLPPFVFGAESLDTVGPVELGVDEHLLTNGKVVGSGVNIEQLLKSAVVVQQMVLVTLP
jgi:hypothetical protein